jgi:hypothetical protein
MRLTSHHAGEAVSFQSLSSVMMTFLGQNCRLPPLNPSFVQEDAGLEPPAIWEEGLRPDRVLSPAPKLHLESGSPRPVEGRFMRRS